MVRKVQSWGKICWIAAARLFNENYTYKASALAYASILAIVPLLSVVVSLLAIFPFFNNFMDLARHYIIENFIPTSGATIEFYLQNFITQASKLPGLGLFFLAITVATLIITVEHTIDEIWGVHKRKKKILTWIIYWSVLILTPILIGLSVLISSYIFSLSWFVGTHLPFLAFVPLFINTAMFSALYIIVPEQKIRWRDGFFGAFIAAILFELAKNAFAFYVKQFPSYELIYGAIAIIPIFLFWIYISWMIVLYGALVTYTKCHFHKK